MAIIYSYPLLGNNLHSNDLFVISDVSSATHPTKSIKAGNVAAFINSYNLGYTVYAGILGQTGAFAPTLTSLQNSTGATFTWARTGAGTYTLTASTAIFTVGKTICFLNNGGSIDTQTIAWVRTSDTVLTITTSADDKIGKGAFEVRIYS